ncbi:MAG: hypothetical protein Kow0047_15840 [Anaerolineae bacterium]
MPSVEVYDKDGAPRNMDWLWAHYGNVRILEPRERPRFRLARIDETEGPAVAKVRVVRPGGQPLAGAPVAFHWPDPELPVVPSRCRSIWRPRAVIQSTDSDGFTGFGLGPGSYYDPATQEGPHTVWIASEEYPSDGVAGLGMLAGTNHRGPLFLTFVLDERDEPGPSEPEPDEASHETLLEIREDVARIRAAVERLAQHLGAGVDI